jgi:hypothetical protein
MSFFILGTVGETVFQVDDSGHWIPQDPARKTRESHRILQENTGNRWNMEAVFRPNLKCIRTQHNHFYTHTF